MAETRAVQLLTIDKVLVHQVYHGESIPLGAGPCQVLLASLDDNAEQAYLLLSIEKEHGLPQEKQGASNKEPLEIVVSSQHQVRVQRSESTGSRYNLHNGELEGAEVQLTLPFAAIQNGQDEAFADVINQYCGLVGAEGGVGDNGRMDLVDEDGNREFQSGNCDEICAHFKQLTEYTHFIHSARYPGWVHARLPGSRQGRSSNAHD